MSSRPKPPNAGKGRVKGVPNKVTKDTREAFQRLVEGSHDELKTWLKQTAEGIKIEDAEGKEKYLVLPNPERAIAAVANLAEFITPKLARTELSTGKETLKIEITDPTRRDNPSAK